MDSSDVPRGENREIRLGTLVTPIPFRPPGMLAKTVSTLDLLSNGRYDSRCRSRLVRTEFEGYSEWNSEQDPSRQDPGRIGSYSQTLDPREGRTSGKFYHAKGAVLDPQPVQKPQSTAPLCRHRSANAKDGRRN